MGMEKSYFGKGVLPNFLNELIDRCIGNPLSSDPDTSDWCEEEAGFCWFNTTEKVPKFWDGSQVCTIATEQPTRIPVQYEFRPNCYYNTLLGIGALALSGSKTTITIHTLYAQAFPVPRKVRVDSIGVYVATAQVDKKLRLGIYNSNGLAYPSERLLDAGEVSVGSVGDRFIEIDETLDAGLWFIIWVTDAGTCQLQSSGYFMPLAGAFSTQDSQAIGWTKSMVYGPLPSVFPSGATLLCKYYSAALRVAELL